MSARRHGSPLHFEAMIVAGPGLGMRWSLSLAEIALYVVFAGLVIWMALDARDRWKQLREHQDPTEGDDAPDDPDPPPAS